MRLVLLDDDGTVLDTSEEFTREDLARLSPTGAAALLGGLQPGA